MPADKPKPKTCKPFSISVKFLTSDDTKEIQFGLSKDCNPDKTAFWTIDFILREQKGSTMKVRVEVHVTIGTDMEAKAEKLAEKMAKDKKISPSKVDMLEGEVTDRALELTPAEAKNDTELKELLIGVI